MECETPSRDREFKPQVGHVDFINKQIKVKVI